MRKIKSALDLAMEKTAHLKDAKKSEGTGEQYQYINAASALARSFLRGKVGKEQVEESIIRYPQEVRDASVKTFLLEVSEGISFSNCLRVADVAQALRGEDHRVRHSCEELRKLHESYRQKLDASRRQLEERVGKIELKKLRNKGIGGTAVGGVNIGKLPSWKNLSSQIEQEFREIYENLLKESFVSSITGSSEVR